MVDGIYPKTLEEAVIMKHMNPEAKLYAGGTDWMVRHDSCKAVIFLNKVEELKRIHEDSNYLYIGAGSSYIELIENEMVPDVLKEAVKGIAAPAIRNVGTIGGNICNASPAGDALPVLYALDAKVEIVSMEQVRILPIHELILGVRRLSLKLNEIVKQIIIPKQTFTKSYYQKVGARQSQALSKLSFVGLADIQDEIVKTLRIAFGSVSQTAVRRIEIEQKYEGMSVKDIVLLSNQIQVDYDEYITPINDARSTAIYRKQVCMNLLADFIATLNIE